MSIIGTLNTNQVIDALYNDKENNGFSYEACKELAEYLDELSEMVENPIELDVIAWRCEWTEYTAKELKESYQSLRGYVSVLEYLDDNTTVLLVDAAKNKPTTWLVREF